MGTLGPVHWFILIVLLLLLFSDGRASNMLGDVTKGFKRGMTDDDRIRLYSSALALTLAATISLVIARIFQHSDSN